MAMVLKGTGVSSGVARGKILRIKNPAVLPTERGAFVLVVSFVTPVIAPLLTRAKALILEFGGITAHGSSIAREFGIPCVVQVDISKIPKGVEVEVNGGTGEIVCL